jgi:hypothetical protein
MAGHEQNVWPDILEKKATVDSCGNRVRELAQPDKPDTKGKNYVRYTSGYKRLV